MKLFPREFLSMRDPVLKPKRAAWRCGYADALTGWGWNSSGKARGPFEGPCDPDYKRGYLAGGRARGLYP